MSQTSKELHKLQAELRDLHVIVRQLQDELRDSRKSLEKERQANRTFNEQVGHKNVIFICCLLDGQNEDMMMFHTLWF